MSTYAHDISPDVLSAGQWVLDPKTRVMRWVERVPELPAEPTPEVKRAAAELIACPTCHAKTAQTCRTRSGHTTTPHMSRLTLRLCQCGAALNAKQRYCPPCRYEVNLANKRDYLRRLRARRRDEKEAA